MKKELKKFRFCDLGRIDYAEALCRQTAVFEALLAAKSVTVNSATAKSVADKAKEIAPCLLPGDPRGAVDPVSTLFFCEHAPVLTLGKSGKETNLLVPEALLKERGIAFFHTNRGGDITYHGPGQITGYPVFDLDQWSIGLREYIDLLEEIVIRFLAGYGLKGERLHGATGVWLEAGTLGRARKICAIGVKSSRYVTMHGFALNILTDLSYFSLINPCGFTDKGVTTLARELGEPVDFEKAKTRLASLFIEVFGG